MGDPKPDAIPLREYVETRLNLLLVATKANQEAADGTLAAFAESIKAALEAARAAAAAAQLAADLRYQQRFEAQSDALSAAFLSQQTAMQTAFTVAEKAVQAALAAADRAVSKAELAADKRFEALNELRQMLNDMVANLLPKTEAEQRFGAMSEKIDANARRIDGIEGRVNTISGSSAGGKEMKDQSRANMAIALSLLSVIAMLAFNLLKK